jgi:hypothetical protein
VTYDDEMDPGDVILGDEVSLSGGFVKADSESVPANDCSVPQYFLANSPQD